MGLRSFFHKIKAGFTRMREPSIPYTSAAKRYGDWGEDEFALAITSRLPEKTPNDVDKYRHLVL